ncbi:Lar family restriction alleviation protein [Burkholderia dolosa]|uniref:Lar family restriction alleviation protein n=1 Tax=Burkholderia dolosa TaxID=152500 RepID=UPI001B9955F6|nr:Lar family restriction alleviation protein [Burkholderia dolosa]MBR8315039.1 Lar family restriction alleviation protein [Burkholderia dolosa]
MPLERFDPDRLELKIAASTYLPPCPFCKRLAIMSSSVNRSPAFSSEPVYQARIACTNHECNASVVANERTRDEAQQHAIAQWSRRSEVTDELAILRNTLTSINGIRNSIIGLHTLNWSEHVYPLVAALDAAGFEGMEYPEARAFYGTMLDRCNAAEEDAERYRCLRRGQHWSVLNGIGDTLRADELDTAVDAARAGEHE